MPPTKHDLRSRDNAELARRYGVTEKTIQNWKKEKGILYDRHNAIDYDRVDSLIRERVHPAEIARRCKCSRSSVKRRMALMGISRRGYVRRSDRDTPPMEKEDRRDLFTHAMICKAINLEMTIEVFTTKWLPTRTGREWAADIAGLSDVVEIQEECGL